MARIELTTRIHAPVERCFDLARSIDLHTASMEKSAEVAIQGVTTGLIGLGEEVTWRARHFGIAWHHTTRITEFARPAHFRDEMLRGAFAYFRHDHEFEARAGLTFMTDIIHFQSPCGWIGVLVDRFLLLAYLRDLIMTRNDEIRRIAESDGWTKFLNTTF